MHKITYTLVLVGALNWGLVGLFRFNLVETLFAFSPMLESLIYVLVGVSALIEAVNHMNCCKECEMVVAEPKKVMKKKRK